MNHTDHVGDTDAMSLDSAHNNPLHIDLTNHDQQSDNSLEMDLDPISSPVKVDITAHNNSWIEEDSDGDAAHSGDENNPPPASLGNARPHISANNHNAPTPFPHPALQYESSPILTID